MRLRKYLIVGLLGLLCFVEASAVTTIYFDRLRARVFEAKGSPVYDVTAYGALCDGSTNDATAISSAITAATTAGGGIVRLPAGTCRIGSSLALTGFVSLVGAGSKATTIELTANTDGITVTDTFPSSGTYGYATISGFMIRPTTAISSNLIHLTSTNGFTIRDVMFDANNLTNTNGSGLYIQTSVMTLVEGCAFGDLVSGTSGTWTNGIKIEASDTTTILASEFTDSTNGINIVDSGGPSGGVSILGCDWNAVTNAVALVRSQGGNSITQLGGAFGSVTTKFSLSGGTSGAQGLLFQGYNVGSAGDYYLDGNLQYQATGQTITANTDTLAALKRSVLELTADTSRTLTSAPTMASGANGQEVTIVNIDTTDSITIQDQGTLASSNLQLATPNARLDPGDYIHLRYDDTSADWVEVYRSGLPGTALDTHGVIAWGDQDNASMDTGTEVCTQFGLVCVGAIEANGTEITNCTTAAAGTTAGWFYALCK